MLRFKVFEFGICVAQFGVEVFELVALGLDCVFPAVDIISG